MADWLLRFVATLPATWFIFWLLERKALRRAPVNARAWWAFALTLAVSTFVGGWGHKDLNPAPVYGFAFGEYLPACLLWLAVSLVRARAGRTRAI